MGLFDKASISDALGKAKELAGKAGDAAKSGIEQTKATIEKKQEEARLAKLPQEGGLKRYEVTYKGGHPQYDIGQKEVKSYPYVIMDIMPDRFSFLPKQLSEKWFEGLEIPYNKVISLNVIERIISSAESFLGSGSNNSDLRQKNVLEFTYEDNGSQVVVRFEMLTGTTVMAQAGKCVELMDLLRNNDITSQFKGNSGDKTVTSNGGNDVIEQIKKLSELKDAGILSEEEFSSKKTELLAKM